MKPDKTTENPDSSATSIGVQRLVSFVFKIKAIDEKGEVSWVEKATNNFSQCSGKGKIWTSLNLAEKTLKRLSEQKQTIYIQRFQLITYELREVVSIS